MSDISKTCSRLGDAGADIVMQAGLADLDGYWLELNCCGAIHLWPLRLLAHRQGGKQPLGVILPRLRCKKCGGPPAAAYLNEMHNREDCHGSPPGWSVQLIGQKIGDNAPQQMERQAVMA